MREEWRLVVTASDWTFRDWSCDVRVDVTVVDVNDNAPVFLPPAAASIDVVVDPAQADASFSSKAVENVDVENAVDVAPSLSTTTSVVLEATIAEDAEINSVVTKLVASDVDLGENSHVSFRLVDADGTFAVDGVEGLVTLTRRLDRWVFAAVFYGETVSLFLENLFIDKLCLIIN